MGELGRLLLITGVTLAVVGAVLLFVNGVGLRIPGDFVFRGRRWTVYLPLGTSLLLSALATLVLWFLSRR